MLHGTRYVNAAISKRNGKIPSSVVQKGVRRASTCLSNSLQMKNRGPQAVDNIRMKSYPNEREQVGFTLPSRELLERELSSTSDDKIALLDAQIVEAEGQLRAIQLRLSTVQEQRHSDQELLNILACSAAETKEGSESMSRNTPPTCSLSSSHTSTTSNTMPTSLGLVLSKHFTTNKQTMSALLRPSKEMDVSCPNAISQSDLQEYCELLGLVIHPKRRPKGSDGTRDAITRCPSSPAHENNEEPCAVSSSSPPLRSPYYDAVVEWSCANNKRLLRAVQRAIHKGASIKLNQQKHPRADAYSRDDGRRGDALSSEEHVSYEKWFSSRLSRLRSQVIDSPLTCLNAIRRYAAQQETQRNRRSERKHHHQLWTSISSTTGGGSSAAEEKAREVPNFVRSLRKMGLHRTQNH